MGMETCSLTPRLMQVAAMVPPCGVVVDVGTDHAYIPVYLIQKGIAQHVVASDAIPGPVARAKHTVEKYGLQQQITVRQADGLEGDFPVDHFVLAGMGGNLICDIVERELCRAKSAKSLILQPMTAVYDVRKFLHHHGFCITREELAREEHRFYHILTAQPGTECYEDDISYHVGPLLRQPQHPLLGAFLDKRISGLDIALDPMEKSNDWAAKEKREAWLRLRTQLQQIKEECV